MADVNNGSNASTGFTVYAICANKPKGYQVVHSATQANSAGSQNELPGRPFASGPPVARLATAGRTNRAIADALFISPKTVEANLGRVYRKLDIATRAELNAALAARES